MAEYRRISLKKELVDAVESFIQRHADFGYRSIAEFVEDAMRKRAEALGIVSAISKPRFTHLNILEDHVTLLDNDLDRIAEIYFQHGKSYCNLCEEHDCEHTRFALSLPKVVTTLGERGWVIEDGKIIRGPG